MTLLHDTLVLCFWKTLLRGTLAAHSCQILSRNTVGRLSSLARQFCATLLQDPWKTPHWTLFWNSLAKCSCRTLLQLSCDTLVKSSCKDLWWDILAAHAWKTLLQVALPDTVGRKPGGNSLGRHACETLLNLTNLAKSASAMQDDDTAHAM